MDKALGHIESILNAPSGSIVPVVFDFRIDIGAQVFCDFAAVLRDAGAHHLPYSICMFKFNQSRWDGVDVEIPVPMAIVAWEPEDKGCISAVLLAMTHQEPISGIEYRSNGELRYCEFGDTYRDVPPTEWERHAVYTLRLLGCCLAALSTRGVSESVTVPNRRMNQKRTARGDRPLPETHVIRLDGHIDVRSLSEADGDVTRASPRPHYRRGHVRKLSDGRVTMVKACIVAGTVAQPKRYEVH